MPNPRARSASGEPASATDLEVLEPALSELARGNELDGTLASALAALVSVLEVDAAAILLVEGSELRLAAGWGLDEADRPSVRLPLAEGFLGLVAGQRTPQLALSAANDLQVRLAGFRRHGVRSLYGVPLLAGGDLIGVAVLGSAHAYDFPEKDKRLFGVFCRQLAPTAGYLVARQRERDERRRRQALFGMVAHDVRTPLSSVKIGAGALARDPGASDAVMVRRTAGIMERAAARIERAIEDLFGLLTIRERSDALARESHDLVALAEQAVDEARARAGERGVTVSIEAIDSPPRVDVDGERVRDALGILVATAVDASPRGGLVTVTVQARGPEVLVAVEDRGPGRTPEELAELFEPAARARTGAKPARPLGLALARVVTEAHGGRMWAASAVGRGTTVFATLPRSK